MMKFLQKNILLFFLLINFFSAKAQVSDEQIYKFTQVIDNISRYYTDSTNTDKIIEKAIITTLKELDPHSTYFDKDEVDEVNRNLEGSFDGIGITYNLLNDTLYIISVNEDGPSKKAGIKPGDRIIKVDGKNIAGIGVTHKNIRKKLLGKKDTQVDITVKRNSNSKKYNFTIIRDKIPVYSIESSYMVTENIGYIRLKSFSSTTVKEFNEALKKLKKSGAEKLIFDLRDNGGGYLSAAVNISAASVP